MIINFFKGFAATLQGIQLISRPGIRRFVLIPLSINIALFSAGIYLLISLFDQWMSQLMPDFPDWLSWLETAISWVLWPLFAVMIFFLVFYCFTFIANLIAAPFNSLLAEKVELMLTGQPLNNSPAMPGWQVIKKSLASEVGKLWYFFKWFVLLLIISVIPIINMLSPALWMLFGAWMLALEYMDYPMANHGHYFKSINQQALNKKSLNLGFGGGLFLLTSIPLLNFICMPAGVAAATALWVKQENKNGR